MTEIDRYYGMTREGNAVAFASWVRLVEMPLRRSLQPFARVADTEVVMQEGLLRMWMLAPRLELSGPDASLRYACRLMRNLALSEARRNARRPAVDPELVPELPELQVDPEPGPDPALRRIILACIDALPRRPRQALLRRLEGDGTVPDRDHAAALGMTPNTFFQSIVRARRLVARCLEGKGVAVEEALS